MVVGGWGYRKEVKEQERYVWHGRMFWRRGGEGSEREGGGGLHCCHTELSLTSPLTESSWRES